MIQPDIESLIADLPDGASVAIPPSRSGVAVAATRALIKRGVKNLHLIAIPTAGIQADMLIGSGCVSVMESAGVTMDEQGQAPCFVAAVKAGTLSVKDTTCPALISALQAGEKGIPFIPMRGLLGSDLFRFRKDYKVIDNPMSEAEDPIVLLPAILPDVALFHAPLADKLGNVWIGKARELMTMAHAAKKTIVTVEEIVEGNFMQDPLRAPATIPNLYITAIAEAKNGAWPLALEGSYDKDDAALEAYVRMAGTPEGLAEFIANGPGPTARSAAE